MLTKSAVMQTYNRLPVSFVKGTGVYLFDSTGKRYLDALSGIAVCGLGHAHPQIHNTIAEQSRTLIHTSNLYEIPEQTRLAQRLCEISGMDQAFFCNSGAEANETAIKLARLYGHKKQVKSPTIVVMDGGFHGRTIATLTATSKRSNQAGFDPLLEGFYRIPYNDINAVSKLTKVRHHNIVAVLLESVLGESGVIPASIEYLQKLSQICTANDWLLMLDEVQTGNGRTGKFYAYQHAEIIPDIVTSAKGLGNGIPIGVCLAKESAANLKPGQHGSTFGGNPLACATANKVLDVLYTDQLIDRADYLGKRILSRLKDRLSGVNQVVDIRGSGLMIGIELSYPCKELVAIAMEAGLLLGVSQDTVIRLLPPLILTDAEADQIITSVVTLITDFTCNRQH